MDTISGEECMHARFPALVFPLAALLLAGPASAALDPGSYAGRGFAPVDDTRLFYEVKGSGDPVVLIHGGQLDSRMWDDQFEPYAREFRVLRYDVRGFGGSPATNAPYSNADDLAALMDYLGMPKAHVVGLSLGGMVATDFAVTHPNRCCRSCSRVRA
jgi:pimeloyl-ACP methyl ester carboxylesterase